MPRYQIVVSVEAIAVADRTVIVEAPNREKAIQDAVEQVERMRIPLAEFGVVDRGRAEAVDVAELGE